MRRQSRTFKWFFRITLVLTFAAAAVFISQPHLIRALREGFPSPVWPAYGYFDNVLGGGGSNLSNKSDGKVTDRLAKLLSQSEARQLLVLLKGEIVLEKTLDGSTTRDLFNSYSMVKSLVGALVFKAVAEGKIAGFGAPIGQYVKELMGSKLGKVAIGNFLDMKSGVLFEHKGSKAISVREPKDLQTSFANPFGPMVKLHQGGLSVIIARLRRAQTGQSKFNYQNINTALLAAALEHVYGVGIAELLSEKIWRPAEAGKAYWRKYDNNKPVSAYCCLYATTRDWAKVGRYLALNGKRANKFLPEKLWQKFFGQGFGDLELNKGVYANHTRYDVLNREGEPLQGRFTYFMGHKGQVVYILPEHDLVVVRFGNEPQLLHSTLYEVWKSINPN